MDHFEQHELADLGVVLENEARDSGLDLEPLCDDPLVVIGGHCAFNPEPLAAASLAQVHEARLHDGRRVALKVQHADIDRIVRLDLRAIRRILGLIQFFTRIRGLESYHSEVREMILEELDFTKEAENITLIAGHFDEDPMVGLPVVVPEFSTRRILTTEFVDGTKVTDVAANSTRAASTVRCPSCAPRRRSPI
mgnify:CR=1 FL=1